MRTRFLCAVIAVLGVAGFGVPSSARANLVTPLLKA
jgi:hypothetical protein